jgi:hypothetical protein
MVPLPQALNIAEGENVCNGPRSLNAAQSYRKAHWGITETGQSGFRSNAWVKPQGGGPLNRRYSTPVGWIGAPQWIYRAEAASAGNSGGAFLAGVIFTIPLHAIRTLVCDRAPSGVAGLIGMARAHVKEHRNH